MKNLFPVFLEQPGSNSADGRQNGSVILIVLMLLVIMSLIGVASTNTTVTENFIVRNSGVRKQNLHLVDAVATEAYQTVNDFAYDDPSDPNFFLTEADITPALTTQNWVHDITVWQTSGNLADWYDPAHVGRVLDAGNSTVPQSLIDNVNTGAARILSQRIANYGPPATMEWDFAAPDVNASPVRYALVGWENITIGGESIGENKPGSENMQQGSILVEYVSGNSGVIRLIMGIRIRMS